MRRLRPGDWICGLGGAALAVLLVIGDRPGAVVGVIAVGAVLAAAAVVGLTATQESPSGPVVADVAAFIWGLAALIALLVQGDWPEVAAAAVLVAGALLALRDERMPGAADPPVARRPAPPVA